MSDEKKLSLVRKLSEVMGEVERVAKSGRNNFHNYDYATEADIVSSVRGEMSKRQLMLIPDVESVEWGKVEKKNGGFERLATMKVRFTVHDGESGESQSFSVMGEGQDVGDKATYKALTGATKYALLKLFLIPTGDDPEHDGQTPAKRAPQQQAPRQGRPSAPPSQQQSAPPAKQEQAKAALDLVHQKLGKAEVTVGFGDHKGKPVSKLSTVELSAAIRFGYAKLNGGKAVGDWVKPLKANLELLKVEEAKRVEEFKRAHPLAETTTVLEPGAQG